MTDPAAPPVRLDSAASAVRAVHALVAGGVTDVVVAPGSRSAPLAYALAEAESAGLVRLHVRIDERSGAFTALGLALGAQRPAAVVTTSGTAVGELLPAVMEANHAAVPLVVVTADRPGELRGTGANQTTVQPGLFGVHVRAGSDVSAGEDPALPVAEALRAALGRPLDGVPTRPPGPVHLNLAYRDPLVPDGVPDGVPTADQAPTASVPARSGPVAAGTGSGSAPATATGPLPGPASPARPRRGAAPPSSSRVTGQASWPPSSPRTSTCRCSRNRRRTRASAAAPSRPTGSCSSTSVTPSPGW